MKTYTKILLFVFFMLIFKAFASGAETPLYWNTYVDQTLLPLEQSCVLWEDAFYIPTKPLTNDAKAFTLPSLALPYHLLEEDKKNQYIVDYAQRSIYIYEDTNTRLKAIESKMKKDMEKIFIQSHILKTTVQLDAYDYLGHSVTYTNEGPLFEKKDGVFIRATVHKDRQLVKELYYHIPEVTYLIYTRIDEDNFQQETSIDILKTSYLSQDTLTENLLLNKAILINVDAGYYQYTHYNNIGRNLLIAGFYTQGNQRIYILWELDGKSTLPVLVEEEHLIRSMKRDDSFTLLLTLQEKPLD